MFKNSFRALAIAGVAGLMPSLASAFTGDIVKCTTADVTGLKVAATVKPGLTCNDGPQALSFKMATKTANQLNACAAQAGVPWDAWVTGKVSKLKKADAVTISTADIALKATTYGSANFAGDTNSAKFAAGGTVAFRNSSGGLVKNGKVTFFGKVNGIATPPEAVLSGVITKGFGVGGTIAAAIPFDATTANSLVLGANASPATACGSAPDPYIGAKAKGNAKCTAAGAPKACCGGPGYGGCGCTAAGTPAACCTAVNAGTCHDPSTELDFITTGPPAFGSQHATLTLTVP